MILYKRKSIKDQISKVKVRNEPYLILNIFFTGVILLIIGYSCFFSPEQNKYPVVCLNEKITGEPCFSCGLSHSFSLIVRGRPDEAYRWNIYGMRIFIFFISQLVLRVVFSIYYLKHINTRRQLVIVDATGSGLIFLISFWPFIESIFKGVF